MITFRYHLTTLVAVFLALAVGIVLGGGPLSELGRGTGDQADAADGTPQVLRARATGAERALDQLAPGLYGESLKGKQVAVLRLPGVTDETTDKLAEQLVVAGATPVLWRAGEALVDVGQKSLVDTLGSQLLTQAPADLITPGVPTYQRMGELLGASLASTDPAGDAGNARTGTVLESLVTAELLQAPGQTPARSPLVLVLGADPEVAGGSEAVYQGIAQGLATQSLGVVVATSAQAPMAAVLSDSDVVTSVGVVDGAETSTGRTATVLALGRALTTRGGSFGITGADGTLPLG